MIEEIFYLDEGLVKITAASVGIGNKRWTCISSANIDGDSHQTVMKKNRFDILPIISSEGNTTEFFKTEIPNDYTLIHRHPILYEDVVQLDTPIREIIKGFALSKRTFYFLNYNSRITGLITLGNLNCRQVQVYIFGIICELERRLTNFIENNLSKVQLEKFMSEKSTINEKLRSIWEHYQELVLSDLENKLIEHLYLIDFFTIIKHFDLNAKLGYSKTKWDELTTINDLRNLVAHPTRSLLDKNNDVDKLWRRIERVEDLSFRLNQAK